MFVRKSAVLKQPAATRSQPPPGRSAYISFASRAAASFLYPTSLPPPPPRHQHQQTRRFRPTRAANMHENVAKLYPNPETSARVMEYSIAHSTPLPEYLAKYHAWGSADTKVPDFLISTFQAQMLIFLARIVGAKKVLEIGVYIGFSSMVWAEAVGSGGRVVGLELSEEYAALARRAFVDNGVGNAEVVVGDAAASLESLSPPGGPFDIVFVDANKGAYPRYLDTILARSRPGAPPEDRLLRPGGLIVADNVLRRGIVADATGANPYYEREVERVGEEQARAFVRPLREFNDKLAAEPRLEAFLMPLFDGLGLARLKD